MAPGLPFTRYVVWLEEIGAQVQGFALLLGDLAEAARLFLAQPGLREAPFPGEATQTLTLKAPEELGPRVSLAQLGHGPKRVEGTGRSPPPTPSPSRTSAPTTFLLASASGPYTAPWSPSGATRSSS